MGTIGGRSNVSLVAIERCGLDLSDQITTRNKLMTTILLFLAVLPVGYGALVAGDFSQKIYKPTRQQVYFVVRNRIFIISLAWVLWTAGILAHLYFELTSNWVIWLTGGLTVIFTILGFLMAPYIFTFSDLHSGSPIFQMAMS